MIRTIQITKHITAQGVVLRKLANGQLVIKSGNTELTGRPVTKHVA